MSGWVGLDRNDIEQQAELDFDRVVREVESACPAIQKIFVPSMGGAFLDGIGVVVATGEDPIDVGDSMSHEDIQRGRRLMLQALKVLRGDERGKLGALISKHVTEDEV